jgi:tripartite-type tricarboxylate transporter receptor subunit TctC
MTVSVWMLLAKDAAAQPYPTRPVRLIVPFTPGGGVDIVARAMAQKMSEGLGQQIVIDNRAGAGSLIGIELAARAAPDGYTILISSSTLTIYPALSKNLPYDAQRDFTPVSQTSTIPLLLVTVPTLPVANVKELIALAREREARGKRMVYASSGVGVSVHLAMELFNTMARVQMVHVPYKNTAQKNVDLISGQTELMFAAIPSTMAHARAGQMKGLAVSGAKRSGMMPEIPTVAESGLPGFELVSWNGILGPAGLPVAVVARLYNEVRKALDHAEVKSRLMQDAADPSPTSPREFAALIKAELAKYEKLVAAANIKAN